MTAFVSRYRTFSGFSRKRSFLRRPDGNAWCGDCVGTRQFFDPDNWGGPWTGSDRVLITCAGCGATNQAINENGDVQ